MSRRLLPLVPAGLVVDGVHPQADQLTICTRPRALEAACPTCGHPSRRLHSHYTRTLADLPWQGRRVLIQVQARRFRCVAPQCPRRIFAERLPDVAAHHGRRTHRLGDVQRHLGLALGGEPGARLSERLGLPLSADTLLRLIRRAAPVQVRNGLRVLGVDDWAWRRGQRYGTILCDLEQGDVVDLLPDRDAATLAAWLRRHPGIEIVARDRAGAYADGVRQGAPQAIQVADRWHLLCNGSDALLQVLDRHRGTFSRVAKALASETADAAPPIEPKRPTKVEERRCQRQHDRDARFGHVVALAQAGLGIRAIMRETGLARNTVRRWMRADAAPTWRKGKRARLTDPFVPYLHQRMAEGITNATRLWREITALGFPGQVTTVRACVAVLRSSEPAPTRGTAVPTWRRPTPRRATRDLLSATEPAGMDGRFYTALIDAVPEIGRAVEEARAFAGLVRDRDCEALKLWLARARDGPLCGLAESLRRDRAAVEAALTLPWSTGPVEGQITRLKLIKRQGYGRADLDLLRARVLAI